MEKAGAEAPPPFPSHEAMSLHVTIPSRVEALCESLADAQLERFRGASNTKQLDRNHWHGIFRGMIGEWAVALFSGGEWLRNDEPYDVLSRNGQRVDVKTTKSGGDLLVPIVQKYKVNNCDALALAWYDGGPSVEVVGWILSREFKSRWHEQRDLPAPAYVVRHEDLRDAETMLEYV